jgi:hypothetical protein
MARVWSDESKLARWLEVELAALDGWASVGAVPEEAAREIQARAEAPTPERVAEIEERTQHDVAAFVDAVAEPLGPVGRWFHYGLTSSDVLDTALALQVVQPLSRQTAVDPSPQKHRVEGLRQVVLGPQLDSAHDALHVLERRDHDDRDVAQLAVRLHLREYLEAVDLRHDDVEQDDVKGFRTQNLQCPTPILRDREAMPFSLEATRKQQAVDRVVVDDKHVCLRRRHVRPCQPRLRARLRRGRTLSRSV